MYYTFIRKEKRTISAGCYICFDDTKVTIFYRQSGSYKIAIQGMFLYEKIKF